MTAITIAIFATLVSVDGSRDSAAPAVQETSHDYPSQIRRHSRQGPGQGLEVLDGTHGLQGHDGPADGARKTLDRTRYRQFANLPRALHARRARRPRRRVLQRIIRLR